MDPERFAHIAEMESFAREVAERGTALAKPGEPHDRLMALRSVELELARRFPGESSDLVRSVAEAQVGHHRGHGHSHGSLRRGAGRGLLFGLAFGAFVLVFLALLYFTE